MRKILYLFALTCFLQNTYCQKTADTPDKPIEISFGENITAPDLKIKKLTAIPYGDSVVFTVTYFTDKDRSLSFFDPPWGTELMYVDSKGLKKNDTIASIKIAEADLKYVNKISMRFSVNSRDRNFIFLNTSDPYLKTLIGKGSGFHNFFSKIFPENFIIIILLCFLVPLFIFVGNKIEDLVNMRLGGNAWFAYNIKTLIFSIILISILLLITKTHIFAFPISTSLNLLMLAVLPANLVFLIERTFKNRKPFWFWQYLSLLSLILGIYIVYFISGGIPKAIPFMYIIMCGFLVGFIRLINNYISYQKILTLKEKELEISRLSELKVRSDLNALQSKINPHFLYNALNSLAELCWKSPERTERMALSLSKLFRYSINKEDRDSHLLKNEIELANLYLSIEKERFGDNLDYQLEYGSELDNTTIPKFILQPLIENAIKHGVAKLTGKGFVKLAIHKRDKHLEIKVYDNGPDFPVSLISGYGLQNIYDKLDILYPNRYIVEMQNGAEKHISLTLKDAI